MLIFVGPLTIPFNENIVTFSIAFTFFENAFFFLGLFSVAMRDLANIQNNSPKWIVLDGDIDPMWIESLNTVMDDNKVSLVELRSQKNKKKTREISSLG